MANYLDELSVLVIEDNQGDYILIEDYLLEKFEHIKIFHCIDFASAVAFIQNNKGKLSLILLDFILPDKEGMALVNEILSFDLKIPVIMLTGYTDLGMAKNSLQVGISDYLIKDEINPTILHKTILFALNRNSFIIQIEKEKNNYENLFNFSPQPTWLIDGKTLKILHANIAAQKKYGISLNDFLNMSFTQLHPKAEEQLIKEKLILKQEASQEKHFTHYVFNQQEIKVNIYFKEININSKNDLIVQSNDISETLHHINTIEIQNSKLKNIAWTQSHVVRAPLARILGIINLIEEKAINEEELPFFLTQLKVSSNELDDAIKTIVEQAKQLKL